jgi:xanthine phosphoribosyltransferase
MDFEKNRGRYYVVSWDQLHKDVRALAARLMQEKNIKGIMAVSRGGLVPAAIVARELEIRLVETVCIASYDENIQGDEARILHKPEGDGEGYIIIDDLVDSGKTGKIIKELYPKALFATVYAKPKGQDVVDLHIFPIEQDVWLLFPWDMELMPNTPMVKASK